MTPEILERLIRMASEEYETAWFVWHGGEPLLLPLGFYKKAIGLQRKYFGRDSHRISNTIQTNGTLIDRRFMDFCRDNRINVGVSFEGPCNNVLRPALRKDAVQKNLDMMARRGHMFSVNATICRRSTDGMIGIYDHFLEKGTALSFSPVMRIGSAGPDMVPDADEYAAQSIKVFEKWMRDPDADMPLMPHLQYVMAALGEPSVSDCAHSSCLTKWISVYPDGSIFPCAKGCPEEYLLCNINDIDRLSDSFSGGSMRRMLSASIARRQKCLSECELFEYCQGGCSIDALSEGSMEMNNGTSCRIFRKVFSHIFKTINSVIDGRSDLTDYNKFVREAILGKLVNPKATSENECPSERIQRIL